MLNCYGWTERDGEVAGCYIDLPIIRMYANAYYMLLLLSAFLILIPIPIYILFGVAITEVIVRASIRKPK